MGDNKKEILSVAEAAQLMGISRMHVSRKIKNGEIRAIKVGRAFIINRADLPGIYRNITKNDKKEVEAAVDKVFKNYSRVIKKLGKT